MEFLKENRGPTFWKDEESVEILNRFRMKEDPTQPYKFIALNSVIHMPSRVINDGSIIIQERTA